VNEALKNKHTVNFSVALIFSLVLSFCIKTKERTKWPARPEGKKKKNAMNFNPV